MKRTYRTTVSALALALAASSASVAAQSADEVMNSALDHFERQTDGIDNYTVTHEAMGFETTTYYEKETVEGHPVFRAADADGPETTGDFGSFYGIFATLADRAQLEGTETVDGRSTHVVSVDDFSDVDLDAFAPPDQEENLELREGVFQFDTEDFVLRKLRVNGDIVTDDSRNPVTMETHLTDYRSVEGMRYPFRMEAKIDGMLESAMSPEEQAEARQQMELLREQLESIPQAERERMEEMLGPQIEQLEAMLGSETLEFTVEVTDLRVNEGPPEGG